MVTLLPVRAIGLHVQLVCKAVMPRSFHLWATSCNAKMVAEGEDSDSPYLHSSSNSADRFLSREILDMNKVIPEGCKDAQTLHTFSPSFTWVPKPMSCSFFFSFPLTGAISARHHQTPILESNCRFLYSVLDMHYFYSCKLAVFNLLQSAQGTISFLLHSPWFPVSC